jgi:hypothetical protein
MKRVDIHMTWMSTYGREGHQQLQITTVGHATVKHLERDVEGRGYYRYVNYLFFIPQILFYNLTRKTINRNEVTIYPQQAMTRQWWSGEIVFYAPYIITTEQLQHCIP